jgi:glutaredoxin
MCHKTILWSRILVLVTTASVGLTTAACDRDSERPTAEAKEADLPDRVTFRIDGEGVFYVTYGSSGKKYPSNRLADIPIAERGVVGVHISGTSPESLVGKQVYVSDLLDAEAGEAVDASLHSFERFRRRSQTGSRAGEHASRVARTTRQILGDDEPGLRNDMRASTEEGSGSEGKAKPSAKAKPPPKPSSDDEIVIQSMDDLTARTNRPGGGVLIRRGRRTESKSPAPATDKPAAGENRSPNYPPVTLYGAEWCPSCQKAKKWLEREDVSFQYRDIDKSRSAKQSMIRFCRQKNVKPGSIPTLRIKFDGKNDRIMQGWSPQMFRKIASR